MRAFSILLLLALVGQTTTAAAASEKTITFAGFGDSFSAGRGLYDVDLANDCQQSASAWPKLAFHDLEIDFDPEATDTQVGLYACSGASIAPPIGYPDIAEQESGDGRTTLRDEIEAFKKDHKTADVITLTIGGNDASFKAVLERCAIPYYAWDVLKNTVGPSTSSLAQSPRSPVRGDCQISDEWIDNAAAAVSARYRDALEMIAEISEPGGTVVVAGYPDLFAPGQRCAWISEDESNRIAQVLQGIIPQIDEAVTAASIRHPDISWNFVDVRDRFEGRGACDEEPAIRAVSSRVDTDGSLEAAFGDRDAQYHPNIDGNQIYSDLVVEAVRDDPNYIALVGKYANEETWRAQLLKLWQSPVGDDVFVFLKLFGDPGWNSLNDMTRHVQNDWCFPEPEFAWFVSQYVWEKEALLGSGMADVKYASLIDQGMQELCPDAYALVLEETHNESWEDLARK